MPPVAHTDHADVVLPPGRDPVAAVLRDDVGRLEHLVPERHRRMSLSPFTFFRATAGLMAADLAATPRSGLLVQACGDAHVSNFGTFATPERRQVFDLNDFDETLSGPWEWDIKRLVTSLVLAAREVQFGDEVGQRCAREAVLEYARLLGELAGTDALSVWYRRVELERLLDIATEGSVRRSVVTMAREAQRQTGEKAVRRFTEVHDGQLRLRSEPPFLVPARDLVDDEALDLAWEGVRASHADYVASLPDERRLLVERYEVVDLALKVVGVGSVGTRCFVVLLREPGQERPLVLQAKEAGRSVLEPYVGSGPYAHQGERVVQGQRLAQATSDIFLGWCTGPRGHDYYFRQARDMKASMDLSAIRPKVLRSYARLCGNILALAHARSGDRVALHEHIGDGADLAVALARFGVRYADLVAADHTAFVAAVAPGGRPEEL